MWSNSPLLPREKLKCMSSLQIVGGYAREGVGMVRSCLSPASPTHFDVSFFSHRPMYVSCSASLGFFPRGNCSMCSCRFSISVG